MTGFPEMKTVIKPTLVAVVAVMAVATAPVAHADRDEAFADQLHSYGIYGQKDYNAWIAKIMCKRLHNGLDKDAFAAAEFVHNQLDQGASTDQAWQFVGGAVATYCPDQSEELRIATQ